MLKKILIFIIVILIGIQIPLIVSLSTVRNITKQLELSQAKMEKIPAPAKVTKGIFSIFKKIPVVGQVTSKVMDVSPILSGGEESLKSAIAVTKQMTKAMYFSFLLTILLIFLLLFLSKKSFIKNLGFSFLINGLICLIFLALIYYFFKINFGKTFEYFYGQVGQPGSKSLIRIPFVPNIIKSFSKDFVGTVIDTVLTRNIISALVGIPLGGALIYLNQLVSTRTR